MTGWVRAAACNGGACIEARLGDTGWTAGKIILRLTPKPGHVRPDLLIADRDEWDAFTAGIKAGNFDQLTKEGTAP